VNSRSRVRNGFVYRISHYSTVRTEDRLPITKSVRVAKRMKMGNEITRD
jgi:hypothetical protein